MRYHTTPIDTTLVTFESFKGRKCTDSPKAIYDYLLSCDKFSDLHFVWFLRGNAYRDFAYLGDNDRTTIVKWGSEDYYHQYAQASIWIANTRIPESIERKKGQIYVQCWHGTPLKKLGCDTIADNDENRRTIEAVIHKDVKRYSYLISPSAYFTKTMTGALDLEALGKEDVVIETGYPRNDFIVNHTKDDVMRVKRKLGIPCEKKTILYAPTYREDNRNILKEYKHNEPIDFERLLHNIDERYIVLFRAHYFIAEEFDFARFTGRVIDVSSYPEVNDLYIISDMLITDYSSVLFDYSILMRPMIFYAHDLLYYRDKLRGLYFPYDDLPGPKVYTQTELEEAINTCDDWATGEDFDERYRQFRSKFTYMDDGKATKRVVERIIG